MTVNQEKKRFSEIVHKIEQGTTKGTSQKNTRAKGIKGEQEALAILHQKGFRILCNNYTKVGGEVDLIAEKDNYLCFIEVKTRFQQEASPVLAVTPQKVAHLADTVQAFLKEYGDNDFVTCLHPRLDVLELIFSENGTVRFRYHADYYPLSV